VRLLDLHPDLIVAREMISSGLSFVPGHTSGQFPRPAVCGASASPGGALRVLASPFWSPQKSSSVPLIEVTRSEGDPGTRSHFTFRLSELLEELVEDYRAENSDNSVRMT
jgi:hypothetical protein